MLQHRLTTRSLSSAPRLDNRTYRVWFRPNLVASSLWDILRGTAQIDVGDERTVTDLNALGTSFYRIEITKQRSKLSFPRLHQ